MSLINHRPLQYDPSTSGNQRNNGYISPKRKTDSPKIVGSLHTMWVETPRGIRPMKVNEGVVQELMDYDRAKPTEVQQRKSPVFESHINFKSPPQIPATSKRVQDVDPREKGVDRLMLIQPQQRKDWVNQWGGIYQEVHCIEDSRIIATENKPKFVSKRVEESVQAKDIFNNFEYESNKNLNPNNTYHPKVHVESDSWHEWKKTQNNQLKYQNMTDNYVHSKFCKLEKETSKPILKKRESQSQFDHYTKNIQFQNSYKQQNNEDFYENQQFENQ